MQLRKRRTPQSEAFPLKNYVCQQCKCNVNVISCHIKLRLSLHGELLK